MTYQELVAAAKAYADRNGVEVANNIDIFIKMAEARMNRVLKTREQSAREYTLTVDGLEYYSLPLDYRGMRNVKLTSAIPLTGIDYTIYPMTYVTPELFDNKRELQTSDGRIYYTIEANQLRIHPCQPEGLAIEMIFYQKVPNLSPETPTNWMSSEHPDIYLAGIVSEIEIFVKNYEVGASWDAKMTRSIEELDSSDATEMVSGPQLITTLG